MFPEKFAVTSVKRVIYVGEHEYKDKIVSFNNPCISNELIFHLGGNAEVHFNEKVLHTEKDVIRFLPQGENFEYTVVKKEFGACIDIVFDTDIAIADEAFCVNVKEDKNLESLFRKAFSVWSGKRDGYYQKTLSILYEIISILQKSHYSPKSKTSIIEPALSYISKNYLKETISVPHLAKLCNISETYLKKLFNERFGLSPKKYITKLKMDYAVEMLSSQMFSVNSIAEALGYENVYYFSRAFKKEMGISPTEYMNKCKSSK